MKSHEKARAEAAADLLPGTPPEYIAGAEVHLLGASKLDFVCPGEALLARAGAYRSLAPATLRRYRREYDTAVSLLVARGKLDPARRDEISTAIADALSMVARHKGVDRKRLDFNAEEITAILEALRVAAQDGALEVRLAHLLVFVGLRLGFRPIEGMSLRRAGSYHVEISSAKFDELRGCAPIRRIDIAALGDHFDARVDDLVAVLDEVARRGLCPLRILENAKKRLTRLSKAVTRRLAGEAKGLSLQALRHLCRKWLESSGADEDRIAILFGHASLETQKRWYSKQSTGKLRPDGMPVPIVDERDLLAALARASDVEGLAAVREACAARDDATAAIGAARSVELNVGDAHERCAAETVGARPIPVPVVPEVPPPRPRPACLDPVVAAPRLSTAVPQRVGHGTEVLPRAVPRPVPRPEFLRAGGAAQSAACMPEPPRALATPTLVDAFPVPPRTTPTHMASDPRPALARFAEMGDQARDLLARARNAVSSARATSCNDKEPVDRPSAVER
ncbi:hypothetical protein [Salinarimonas ramus]|uniref:Uncharacterized protein n=1 Tax=Salinarimonas ramus TaxID=690164 RepID=A0A917QG15_9HYPH|nr:hypothetical protein [Salinarimonas ramus]GGK47306.1 hypothetical protein GCM10011322_37990 [Salinarimonas ramus]